LNKSLVVQCDNASIPTTWRGECADGPVLHLNRSGPLQNLNLDILHELSDPLSGVVKNRAYDLVTIAAYVYIADQLVSRGGKADLHGDSWQRHFRMCIPVGDPDFWNTKAVRIALEQTLDFVSEDLWNFAFSEAPFEPGQFKLSLDERAVRSYPDTVVLFSGGADSLAGTVEAVLDHGLKPVLVSHQSVFLTGSIQQTLVDHMKRLISEWQFPQSHFVVNKSKTSERDTTQRTRSFLFASLGAAVASSMGIRYVMLADNGIVSLNLPINGQLLGSTASRSTHAKFLYYFNSLARLVLPEQPQIVNPLRTRTKAECLSILKQHNMAELLLSTNSCAHRRNLSSEKMQCGVCSQCIDRRYASLASGMEKFDPVEKYKTDILHHGLDGDALTMVESYLRFARETHSLSGDALYVRYPELANALVPDDPKPVETTQAYVDLVRRHSKSVMGVMADQVRIASTDIVSGNLPPTCGIRLSAQAGTGAGADFLPSDDYRSAKWQGWEYTFTPRQAKVVKMLHQVWRAGVPTMSWNQIKERLNSYPERMSDIFKKSPAWGTLVIEVGRGLYRLNF
jgi:7-cyano-7-deazaguanine synthase in queuosine biosynthesis